MSRSIGNALADYFFYIFVRVRPFTRVVAQKIAESVKKGERILEIGSGWKDKKGNYYFSSAKYFEGRGVEFIQSDVQPSYGHRVVDVNSFDEVNKYNHVLCFHVLDDVYSWEQAFLNLYKAVTTGGFLHVILPGFTLLDRERDYYRFTEALLREFCRRNNLNIVHLETHGFERFPFAYYIRIKK